MSRRRQERVTELIHQEISKRIPHLKDPGLGFITILAVRLSPDFMQAKVFYSVLGSADEQERTKAALDRARGHLRGELGKLESLKFPPEILFVQDHSAEEAQKVLEVLGRLERDWTTEPASPNQLPSPEQTRHQPKPEEPRKRRNPRKRA